MKFKVTPQRIPEVLLIEPAIHADFRGYFKECYNQKDFDEFLPDVRFVQDNESMSQKGVIRGLHFQDPPFAQAKLVRVVKGAVLDVAVDIRKNSPTCGKHYALELNETDKTMIFIPEGFAHGFLSLADNTILLYKCTQVYNKDSEKCILWDDPDLNINWGINNPIVSEKDKNSHYFAKYSSLF